MKNVMTIDVEDYFHVSALEPYISRSDWETREVRIMVNLEKILSNLEKENIQATFFILGWVARKYPDIVKLISQTDNEVASHGFDHKRITELNDRELLKDISDTKIILEDLTGKKINGYRAPSFSINKKNLHVYKIIKKSGYEYSSSVNPIKHDLYGIPNAPRTPFCISDLELIEIPISTISVLGKRIPCGGGGYFRLMPYFIYKNMIRYLNTVEQKPCLFYFHPWEIDPDQPRIDHANTKSKFRHYTNLDKMEEKLNTLFSEFRWYKMEEYLSDLRQNDNIEKIQLDQIAS